MLVSRRRFGPLAHEIWVYEDRIASPWGFREYRNTVARRPGYDVIPHPTIVVDLRQSADEILAGFNATTRNEVRKAQRLGVIVERSTIAEIVPYFAEFARQKGVAPIAAENFDWMNENAYVTAARLNGETLAMHSYFVDPGSRQVRLFNSVSHFRDRDDASTVSAAKRYLHFADMLDFKAQGIERFDLGGLADGSMGRYKAGFGGQRVDQVNLRSWPLVLAMKLKGRR